MLDRQQSVDSPGTGLDRTDSQRTMVGSNGSQYRNRQQSQQDLPSGLNSSQSFGSGGDGGPYRGNHAFGGRPHGYSAQNGSGGVDAAEMEMEAVEDIPTISARMVPMSVVVGRLITFAYTELVTLVDTMPSRAEGDRLNEILKYTEHMTDLLTKLLVLVRWAKNAPQIQKCQNVIAYLDLQNRYFDYSVTASTRHIWQCPTNAVDILTTGTYQRLPAAIKRAREPIPLAMRQYRIANGRIVFTVHKEFEATLTLLQFDHNIPWHVVNVRVLVTGDKSLPDEHQIVVNARKIVDLAQHLLIESNPVPVDTSPEQQQKHTACLSARPPQLAQLYDFLHRQCLVVLLETIVKQAAVLRRTRWENLLQVEMGPDRSVLTLRYWTSPRAASSLYPSTAASRDGGSTTVLRGNSIVFRLCSLPIPRPIHASALDGPDALEASPADSDATVTWSANSGLGTPRVWTRTVSQASELVTSPSTEDNELLMEDFDMVLDPEAVNTEKLLRQVTWRHARTILKALHASVVESGLFSDNAVELMYVLASGATKGESELTREEISLGTVTPRLRAWYRQDEGAVDIFVDTYTGRLVVRASEAIAANTSLSEAMVSQLADQLNRGPWRLAELLVDMRSSLALVDLDSLAFRSLGLRPQSTQGSKAPGCPGLYFQGSTGEWSWQALRTRMRTTLSLPVAALLGQGRIQALKARYRTLEAFSGIGFGVWSGGPGFYQPSVMASNFPLRISQQEADALVRDVAGVDNPLSRIRFYKIEGTEGVEEQLDSIVPNSAAIGAGKGEWYIMVAMTDRLRFRLVLLNPHPIDQLMFVIGQIISLQVDRLFSSVARRLMAEKQLDSTIFSHPKAGAPGTKRSYETSSQGDLDLESKAEAAKGESSSERKITEKHQAGLPQRVGIHMPRAPRTAALANAAHAVENTIQLPLPSFSTSPHGHRAAVSKELSVVGLDRMGLYELDEQVPTLLGVLPDESRRMVSIRIASDELDPSMRADLSPSTRSAGKSPPFAERSRAAYATMSNSIASNGIGSSGINIGGGSGAGRSTSATHSGTRQSLIGRHVVPCQVIASIPVALDGLPTPVAQAYADAVYFGAHAAADGGKGGYCKMVLVYKQVSRALQCLIRDWSEHHLMTHIGRHMYSWEQQSLRRMLVSTTAFYPFNAGPYTGAVANILGSWRGHQSTEIIIRCMGTYYLSISCRVPYPFANEDTDKSMYPPNYEDSGGSDLSFHLTLADVDVKANQIRRIASTWPWVFAHNSRSNQDTAERPCSESSISSKDTEGDQCKKARRVGFEVSTSLSRWLRTLQARLNMTGDPMSVLSVIMQLMPVNNILAAISPQDNIQSLPSSAPQCSRESLLRLHFKDLVSGDNDDGEVEPKPQPQPEDSSHLLFDKLVSLGQNLGPVFDSVKGLNVAYMYTASDNVRLVFNSRYVVDMRLVSSDLFHISDAVGAARSFNKQSHPAYARASAMAPKPLVTATTEPIPLFSDWLEAMSRGMKFDWAKLEKGMSAILRQDTTNADTASGDAVAFQRNMFRLRPDASKSEQMLFRLRELHNKQNSAKFPILVPLAPSAMLCSHLHLVAVIRSLMQWLVQSVHLRDQIESAISRTQDIIEQKTSLVAPKDMLDALDPHGCVKERLVVNDDMDGRADRSDSSSGGSDNRQVMIVGFTGARESVRCEFLMRAGLDSMDVEVQKVAAAIASIDDGDEDIMSVVSDLYMIPTNLMQVDLDVRIVPMNRPPNGITDAAAAYLVSAFKAQTSSNRHRAGVLVRILALPPQLVMDTVDIAKKLEGKVKICALQDGLEHDIRLDANQSKIGQWQRLFIQYALLTGTAQVVWAIDPSIISEAKLGGSVFFMKRPEAMINVWNKLVDNVVAKLDSETVFTRDMGKSGKSRWYDIVAALYEAQHSSLSDSNTT
ncbi:hypothetical protein BX661DRAFT_196177 [Kickxella alabastrina]|uniref:uncharacterized protein n=1 Tax=Kickxella alabastrina TaxID=61397 RepID=UPI00221F7D5A|nr:uncharacterized protein BX661DRAFT_196177 [Kickxella alabastrina]KAI7833659.1 hypothetical protein BX661DRAFT_196177 [Kickxella alabastrina]